MQQNLYIVYHQVRCHQCMEETHEFGFLLEIQVYRPHLAIRMEELAMFNVGKRTMEEKIHLYAHIQDTLIWKMEFT